jgi:2-polyprenyl-3-methyl-5-hydroxy-6-metoxy-1,4-benzoquinol methylase
MEFTKENKYFQNVRDDLLELIPPGFQLQKVLDIGCGDGSTGGFIKQKFNASEVIGVELNDTLEKESLKRLDRVIIGDIEKMELDFDPSTFDCIILADVLEHLYDPWSLLNRLKLLLKPSGVMLASVPNVQHVSVFISLMRGEWRYVNEGTFDSTHIRFFTRNSITEMFDNAGLVISRLKSSMGKEMTFLNHLTFGLFSGFLTYRYFIRAELECYPKHLSSS